MTRELIIEGQHVDLPDSVDITLEYANNITGEPGKINLSHSYTIKIPRTIRNAKILDEPGIPAHESGSTRRFLDARYYLNGIDLMGPVQAYLLKASPSEYELALVWNTLESLQTLSQSTAMLNDLPDLPVMQWLKTYDSGELAEAPDYTASSEINGALFARYTSGVDSKFTAAVSSAAPHPSMRLSNLLERILVNAGVPYEISHSAQDAMRDIALLAAPDHAPSLEMEIESGRYPQNVLFTWQASDPSNLGMGRFVSGWDAPGFSSDGNFSRYEQSGAYYKPSKDALNLYVNMYVETDNDLSGAYILVKCKSDIVLQRYFEPAAGGWLLSLNEDLSAHIGESLHVGIYGVPRDTPNPSAIDARFPIIAVYAPHDAVNLFYDNRFPLEGNLPKIKQWEFAKSCAALFGLAMIIQSDKLHLLTFDELLTQHSELDWSEKVDSANGDPQELSYALSGWAQKNLIAYKEDTYVNFDPNGNLIVQDRTLNEQSDRFQLPFAPSVGDQAIHYKAVDDYSAEDIKIEPRIFKIIENNAGERELQFTQDMYGSGLIERSYQALQETVRKPVTLALTMRLNELDLAGLDMTRPVYLSQFGKYYMILKIQTSDTDLCKVELLQLP